MITHAGQYLAIVVGTLATISLAAAPSGLMLVALIIVIMLSAIAYVLFEIRNLIAQQLVKGREEKPGSRCP